MKFTHIFCKSDKPLPTPRGGPGGGRLGLTSDAGVNVGVAEAGIQ